MKEDDKMICPVCKVVMNFHAVKVDYTSGRHSTDETAEIYGGILEEFHSCPRCGMTAERELRTAAQ
jgi:ribosomal protein S27AE